MEGEEAASSVLKVKTTMTSVGGEWKDEETVLHCKETKVCGVHLTQRCGVKPTGLWLLLALSSESSA
jgi:hypothetical protein